MAIADYLTGTGRSVSHFDSILGITDSAVTPKDKDTKEEKIIRKPRLFPAVPHRSVLSNRFSPRRVRHPNPADIRPRALLPLAQEDRE